MIREKEMIEKIKEFLQMIFSGTDKAHDFQHSLRVYHNALHILKDYKYANEEIVSLAALLHDVSDKKLFQNSDYLDKWFKENPSTYEEAIRKVISEISFSKGQKPTSIESEIVQDADRLDAIGAIGIARVFTYGGSAGRPIYSESEVSSFDHFYDKLFKLADLMNTEKGREIAKKRHVFMKEYIDELIFELEECS